MSNPIDSPPLFIRLYNFMFDNVLSRSRILLVPFRLITIISGIISQIVWAFSNEYTKRKFGSCGLGVRIHGPFRLTSPHNFHVGNNVHINNNAFLRAEGGLIIGDNTHISRNLVVYTMNHNYEGKLLPYDSSRILKPVTIGKNVWIGMNVLITPGTTIGDGSIIGMGSIISRDVQPLSIIGSASQRVLKIRDENHYNSLEESNLFSEMSGFLSPKKSN